MGDDLDFGPSFISKRPTQPRGDVARGVMTGRAGSLGAVTQQGGATMTTQGGVPGGATQGEPSSAVSGAAAASAAAVAAAVSSVGSVEAAAAPLHLCVLLLQALAPAHPAAVCRAMESARQYFLDGPQGRCHPPPEVEEGLVACMANCIWR